MSRPARISVAFVAGMFVLVGWLHLGTPLLAALFSFFALHRLCFARRKWLAVLLFAVLVVAGAYAIGHFLNQAVVALPKVAEKAIPSIITYAESQGVELPFSDYQSLKGMAMDTAKEQFHYVGNVANVAKGVTRQMVFLLIGLVIAVSVFLNSQMDLDRGKHAIRDNLYSLVCEEIAARFDALYHSFARVMGAQLIISGINTALTSVFVLMVALPHAFVVIGVTFLCGLLPVIGNLISNTIIVGIAFTVSPKTALGALTFLVVIHKLEYFLNSKIIGDRIKNPVWLTLIGLIVGEKLLGLPGMILAPVVLHYLKMEGSKIEVKTPVPPSPTAEATVSG